MVDPVNGHGHGNAAIGDLADPAHVCAQATPSANGDASTDLQFIDKARDIVGLYLDPPANALVYG